MKRKEVNLTTGEIKEVDLTQAEIDALNAQKEIEDAESQKIQEAIQTRKTNRTSAINKLKGATYSALTDAEAEALFGE
jgi:mannitol-1-phosphate/altronate dehydrogenase